MMKVSAADVLSGKAVICRQCRPFKEVILKFKELRDGR